MWVDISQSIEGPNRTKAEGQICSLCLREDIQLHLLWDISAPGPQASDSDGDLHHQPPDSQAFEVWLNYTTGPPESPAYRWQIMGLLGLHNCLVHFS